jgi:hypothetical protein
MMWIHLQLRFLHAFLLHIIRVNLMMNRVQLPTKFHSIRISLIKSIVLADLAVIWVPTIALPKIIIALVLIIIG